MKVSLLKLLLCTSLVVFLFSCQKDGKIPEPQAPITTEVVPLETARSLAQKFAAQRFTASPSGERKISAEKVVGESAAPYFYIFNFEDKGGFVIVSAEMKHHPILAYNDKGEFKSEGAPYGITAWVETTKENIDFLRTGKIDNKKAAYAEWRILAKELSSSEVLAKLPPEDPGCEEHTVSTQKGPFLSTTWGQGCGYNDLCPTNTSGMRCGHFPTGCVATAMAQIMRYWQRPTTYNWASMASNWGTFETARLMSDIGTSVSMSYSDNGSGAPHENIPGSFKNTFGYASATNIDYQLNSYSTVQSNLNYSRPVLLCGYNTKNTSWFGMVVEYQDGHEWVCDGYLETQYYWCNSDGTGGGVTYLSFHMNWGWDGASDGWYGFDNWAPSGTNRNYQYARRAIVNIYP
jgi:hypothetical protein